MEVSWPHSRYIYDNYDIVTQGNGPGVRVANVTTSGGEIAFGKTAVTTTGFHAITKNFTYVVSQGSTQTSGKITRPPSFGYTDGGQVYRTQSDWTDGTQIMYSRVTESTAGQGYREYLFSLPNMYPDTDPNQTKAKVARQAGSSCSNTFLKNGPYNYPFAPLKDMNYLRGLPISTTDYNNNGNKTKEKITTYSSASASTTSVIKGLRYEVGSTGDLFFYGLYEIPVNQSQLVTTEIVNSYSEEIPANFTTITNANVYNSKNFITQSTNTNSDGSVIKQFVKYAQDFNISSPLGSDQQATAIFKLNTSNRTAEVVETYQTFKPVGGVETLTSSRLNLFKDYTTYVGPYQTQSFVQGATSGTAPTTSYTTTTFTADPNYKVKGAIVELANALPINATNPITQISSGTHYATGLAAPLASFANCKAEQAVYEGFEFVQDRGLTYSGTGVSIQTIARAGKKSLQLNSTNSIVSSTAIVSKKENTYRISCWIYAAQNSTLTVQAKNGATVQSSVALNYVTPNQWKYIETYMDMTAVSTSFTLQLLSNATILIDDFVAMPKSARVSYSSYIPFIGTTDQVDDRGNSSRTDFDVFGRPLRGYDRNRNLKEVREYVNQRSAKIELSANFTTSSSQYIVGQNSLFTASTPPACLSPVTYSWSVRDPTNTITNFTGSAFNFSFPLHGYYSVTLTTSTTVAGYSPISYTENICVTLPNTLTLTVAVASSTTILMCDVNGTPNRTFTASFVEINPAVSDNLPCQAYSYCYAWYITDSSGLWQPASNLGATFSGSKGKIMTFTNPGRSYQVYCVTTIGSPPVHPKIPNSSCNEQAATVSSSIISITYVNNGPCQ